MGTMISKLKFILTVLRQSVIREMQFRANLLANLSVSLLEGGMLAVFYSVVLGQDITFQVWREKQVLFFVGTFLIIHNLFKAFLSDGVGSLGELVRTGNLDGLLLQPLNARLLLALSRINLAPLASVGLGLWLVARSGFIPVLVRQPALGAAYFALMLLGVYFLYTIDFVLMCSSFWIVKTGELDSIFATAVEFGNKPHLIYPEWLQFIFSTVLTFFLAGNYQVMIVAGGMNWTGLLLMVVSLFLWSLLGRSLWNRGLRRYHGASR